jgi:two-component system OmpR family sensor kinase
MRRSLQWRLSWLLGGAILAGGLVAALAALVLAYGEAKEFQDDMLRQVGLLAARASRGAAPAGLPHQEETDGKLSDPESRIVVLQLPGDPAPAWLAADLPAGLNTVAANGGQLRVFVYRDAPPRITVVAQPTDTRDELALNSALRTLLPLVLLLPLLAWLIVRIVRGELAPVSLLAKHLDAQPADRPLPLADADLPAEIVPFVQAINRLLVRVGDLMDQQRRFIADAAHELRTPLTALSVQAQNLRQAGTPAAVAERIAPLQDGIERAARLAEQLLSLARTQAGTAAPTAVDVSALVRELIAESLPLAEAKGIDLGLDEALPLTLAATPERLRLVLRNALENALKYAPAGGEVTVRVYGEGADAIVDVVDNGPGIPAAERARVFEPFYRLPGTTAAGSGLGLAIAYEAALQLPGTLSLHGRTGGSGLVVRYRQRRGA